VAEVEIVYTGPPSGAPACAHALADADGVELTASQRESGPDDGAVLRLTLSGTEADIEAAVVAVSRELPPGATLAVAD